MTESNQLEKNATGPPAVLKDVLLASMKESADEARQHENQRERMTTLIIAIGAGSLGLATSRIEVINLSLLGSALIVLGLYGAVFSLKHYERNRRHMAMYKAVGDRLFELYPESHLQQIREKTRDYHQTHFWLTQRLQIHHLWIGLPLMVSVLGVALLFSK